ncbi:hypothetical protein [Cupriavidus plantarum]|uniref:Uncharacterized protein n=1 Tax=Cupriavidus plantarum TaxID=942865 RepID=A0A316ESU8_9BURK|nr:hypothetical protein [Cupriavidus plantarum]PWK33777.1 hypothetical protein C7419_10396 [Cupriavidus plantarum]REE90954.1 hypothetical protein C7418_4253 [Cupriavidus plantarum]RLK33626.1 hypothetical protein C7417_4276 [Cupriavidus plantarum]CAG2148395.1 hypothetical protein LMG26296_04329 [Cupriavidus plantarum]
MTVQHYCGHEVQGFARLFADNTFQAMGCVMRDGDTLATSGPLGLFHTRERALAEGLAWGKVWVDQHRPAPKPLLPTAAPKRAPPGKPPAGSSGHVR